jgi:hypothetical protein
MDYPSDAEFERDRKIVGAIMRKVEEEAAADCDPDPVLTLEAMDLMSAFYRRHRNRLEAEGVDVTTFLRDAAERTRTAKQAIEYEEKVIEKHLQAQANRAEAHANLVEWQYKVLKFYESRTEADWATQTPAQQEELRDLIDKLRDSMPGLLASLPIEKRRELEGMK